MSQDLLNDLSWPPTYSIKRHPRARYVKLKASPHQGLEIVVPMRFNLKQIPDILEHNKSWIEKRLLEIQATEQIRVTQELPELIHLRAINQIWPIQYIKSNNKKLRLMIRPQQELVVLGNIENKENCKKILIEWTKSQAHIHLNRLMKQLSEQTKLQYEKITIRDQRSRWGSCTSKKSINLNYKLIFLDSPLATHILIHELCHTVHLNHSAKFWRLVASFDPLWEQHNKEVRHAEKWMPVWLT